MVRQFKISVKDQFQGQVTSLSSHFTSTNKIVKEKLTPTQLTCFNKIVSGGFVDMEVILNRSLVHSILLREVNDDRKDVMMFDLYKIIAIFTKENFLLVCGKHLEI